MKDQVGNTEPFASNNSFAAPEVARKLNFFTLQGRYII
jgi:hypothetical protein